MKNKRMIMAFSALQILIFHLWICIGKSRIELFLKQTAYIGVDVFFFVSAYSLAGRKVGNYGKFVWSRLKAVYLKFILFALVACLYCKWTVGHFLKVIGLVDLFQKGGGSFLWFLPAIMLFYLIYPLFEACNHKCKRLTAVVSIFLWAIVAFVVTCFTNEKAMFIYWNRIPVFLLGYYTAIWDKTVEEHGQQRDDMQINMVPYHRTVAHFKAAFGVLFLLVGAFLLYQFAFIPKLQTPFRDMFYLMGIPASIGLVWLIDLIPLNADHDPFKVLNQLIQWIGNSSLEIYAVQMIFGYRFANVILNQTGNVVVTNFCVILFVVLLSVLMHYGFEYVKKYMSKFTTVLSISF